MRRTICRTVLAAFLVLSPLALHAQQSITLFHFSDYHSHALPFYEGGEEGVGGIARAIRYLQTNKGEGLVFSGGDSMNLGAPSWSDKYHCVEWPWWDGIVDAMAYGNHDSDYGPDVFQSCRAGIQYPILSANTEGADGKPLFDQFAVFERNGLRIGVFALAGSDFERLVKPALRPAAGAKFTDPVAAARRVVQMLREREGVDAVVMIGHQMLEDDEALARAVPGIDLIFGTHAHLRRDLYKIQGTSTWLISPFQYLSLISRVELRFEGKSLKEVKGGLVRMSHDLAESPEVRARVEALQKELEGDPKYAALFEPVGETAGLETAGQLSDDAPLGNFATDVMRRVAKADVAISTSSSFREPLAPGVVRGESLRAAMPYPNPILVYEVSGERLQRILDASVARRGTDFFSQVAGLTFSIRDGKATGVKVGRRSLNTKRTYRLAVTSFQAKIAGPYKELFADLTPQESGKELREEVTRAIASGGRVKAPRGNRIR